MDKTEVLAELKDLESCLYSWVRQSQTLDKHHQDILIECYKEGFTKIREYITDAAKSLEELNEVEKFFKICIQKRVDMALLYGCASDVIYNDNIKKRNAPDIKPITTKEYLFFVDYYNNHTAEINHGHYHLAGDKSENRKES